MNDQYQFLNEAFNRVNDWLKFAEAKNAGLVGFSAAVLAAAVAGMAEDFGRAGTAFFLVLAGSATISFTAALLSMLPILRRMAIAMPKENESGKNLIFFGAVVGMNPPDLLNALSSRYGLVSSNRELELDLAEQFLINSEITFRKMAMFKYGCQSFLVGCAVSSLTYCILWIAHQMSRSAT